MSELRLLTSIPLWAWLCRMRAKGISTPSRKDSKETEAYIFAADQQTSCEITSTKEAIYGGCGLNGSPDIV